MHHTWSSLRSIDGSCHCMFLEDMAHSLVNSYKKYLAVRCVFLFIFLFKRLISYLFRLTCCIGLVSLATLFNAARAFIISTSISWFTLTNCVTAGGAIHLHLPVFTWSRGQERDLIKTQAATFIIVFKSESHLCDTRCEEH